MNVNIINSNRFETIHLANDFMIRFETGRTDFSFSIENFDFAIITAIVDGFEVEIFEGAIEDVTREVFFEGLLEADYLISEFLTLDDDGCYFI